MFDIKNRRHFLKRIKYPELTEAELYPGATVTVFARQLALIEYGDESTRRAVESRTERTLAMIKPDGFRNAGQILDLISGGGAGLAVANLRMARLSRDEAAQLYAVHKGGPFLDKVSGTSNPHLAWRATTHDTTTSPHRHHTQPAC